MYTCTAKLSWAESVGHVVSKKGLCTADSKVEAVLKARVPSNSAELR